MSRRSRERERESKRVNNGDGKLPPNTEIERSVTIDDALGAMMAKVTGHDHQGNPIRVEWEAKVYYSNRTWVIMIKNRDAHALRLDEGEIVDASITKKIPVEQQP